jgi:hemerythrin superfamily protein
MPSKSPAKKNADAAKSGGGRSDAVTLLEGDHRAVEALFEQFDEAAGASEQRELALAICAALKVHAAIEEQLFYPAAMAATGEADLLQEALVEHASAKDLIAQIETGNPGEPLFAARVTVLGEYIAHHVAEEEDELFPKCRKSDMNLDALGELMLLRKQALVAGMALPNPFLLL